MTQAYVGAYLFARVVDDYVGKLNCTFYLSYALMSANMYIL